MKGARIVSLAEYFEKSKGLGVLATANAEGAVDAALYARPHVVDEETLALIMSDRLSHRNLQSNPHAVYLFVEKTEGYVGKRLYLTKVREETDSQAIAAMRRRQHGESMSETESKYLVYFRVEMIRPLVGDK
jgi:hypothetical protein